jgi:hypothetical protein
MLPVVSWAQNAGASSKGEFEQVEVDEHGDKRPNDVVSDTEQGRGRLDHDRFPLDVEAPYVHHQTWVSGERPDGHSRQQHRHHYRCRCRRRLVMEVILVCMLQDGGGRGAGEYTCPEDRVI